MNGKTFNNDFIPYEVKKRFIVVSIWGCAIDYGFMNIEEIEELKQNMIGSNGAFTSPIQAKINCFDDIIMLCWYRK